MTAMPEVRRRDGATIVAPAKAEGSDRPSR